MPEARKEENERIVQALTVLQHRIHETAKAKGWWDEPEAAKALREAAVIAPGDKSLDDLMRKAGAAARIITERNDGELIALMHSELSEGLEALRHDAESDKIPPFQGIEEELADCMIRILDAAGAKGWNVIEAMMAKLDYNDGRSWRHNGKKF